MLRALHVNQFVIVDRLALELDQGFTVLTGETGAGKSILIDALDLILGGKGDATLVREGSAKADLSAEFEAISEQAVQWCQSNDFDATEGLILRRTIDCNGKSKAWVNGQPVTLAQLRDIACLLVDIHGQHAHQALMRPNAQRALLDEHAGLSGLARQVSDAWKDLQKTRTSLNEAQQKAKELTDLRERLQWKIDEISGLKLTDQEWPSLSDEQRRLSHAAELKQTAQASHDELQEDDHCLISRAERMTAKLLALVEKDERLKPAVDALNEASIQLREAADMLSRYLDRADLDPARLAEVEARVQAIFSVAQKLKVRPQDLPDMLATAQAELSQAQRDADIDALTKLAQMQEAKFMELATQLSSHRAKACKKLSKDVTERFHELAMAGMSFQAVCEKKDSPSSGGLEDIVFMLKGHEQAAAQPIHKVASGGELSRISLAIAVVTSAASAIPTLIFDEVDAGIGGNVGHTIGKLLRALGSSRQVLCVTHLPQVAARGHHHLRVLKKTSKDGQPQSDLAELGEKDRIDEIARMLGDEGAKTTSREHAKSLLALA